MIAFNRRTKVYVCRGATDMRSSYDSLINRVKIILKQDPFSGHLFLFINKRKNSCKCIFYDGTGFLILSKRLESGVFTDFNSLFKGELVLTEAEFGLFLEGSDLSKRFIESPREIKYKKK